MKVFTYLATPKAKKSNFTAMNQQLLEKGRVLLLDKKTAFSEILEYLEGEGKNYALKKSDKQYWKCINVREIVSGRTYVFRYCFSDDFPYSKIDVYIEEFDKFMKWPHFEKNGKMCLEEDDINDVNPFSVVEEFESLRNAGMRLIYKCLNGSIKKDLVNEFPSYWVRHVNEKGDRDSVNFLTSFPEDNCNIMYCYETFHVHKGNKTQIRYFDHDKDNLYRFIKNKEVKFCNHNNLRKTLFIRLPNTPFPDDYDKLANDVLNTIEKDRNGVFSYLKECTKNADFEVICCFKNEDGFMLAGIVIKSPLNINFKKFKPNTFNKYKGQYRIIKEKSFKLKRRDFEWVNGRDRDEAVTTLHHKKVLIIGCGSIGSFVVKNLAMSGVGELHIIDSDTLSEVNISRHFLGEDSVFSNKSIALSRRLSQDYPHLTILGLPYSCSDLICSDKIKLSDYDLIISATGYLNSGALISEEIIKSEGATKILHVFTETNALVGHAIAIIDNSSCLMCGYKDGVFDGLIIDKEHSERKKEPGCGGYFNPYGGIAINYINLMTSELAIDILLDNINKNGHYIYLNMKGEINDNVLTELGKKIVKEQAKGTFKRYEWLISDQCKFGGMHDKI